MKVLIYIAALLCLCLTDCGHKDRKTDLPTSLSNHLVSAPIMSNSPTSARHDPPIMSNSLISATHDAPTALDSAVKLMDDFSAALGAQYARFSYDTNRVLTAQYTNYVRNLPQEEFVDFLADFYHTCRIRGVRPGEYDLLYAIVCERLAALVAASNYNSYDDVAYYTLQLGFLTRDIRMTTFATQWLNQNKRATYETCNPTYIVHAMGLTSLPPDYLTKYPYMQEYMNEMLVIYRNIAEDERVSEMNYKQHLRAQLITGSLECYMDPESALRRYSTIREDVRKYWKDSKMESRLCDALDIKSEGLKKGLRGDALVNYTDKVLNGN